jgi:hypothetical protein
MSLDSFKLIEGSYNYNIVATAVTFSQQQSLQNLEVGELLYVTDSTPPSLQVYTGVATGWLPLGTTSASIQFVPTGNISATNLQSAIAELDTEKVNVSSIATVATSGNYTDLSNKPDLSLKADLVNGMIPVSQIPASIAGQLSYQGVRDMTTTLPAATNSNSGHFYITTVAGNGYDVGDWAISNGATWDKIANSTAVSSVNGKVGIVTLVKADIGLSNVDNTSDANKPISTTQQAALDLKAPKASPAFTGDLTVAGTVSDSLGNIRSLPQNSQTAAYTLAATDCGKHVKITTGGITVPPNVFNVGDSIVVYNDSSTSQTINCSAIVSYVSGTNAIKTSITLAARGLVTFMFYKQNEVVISGDVS